MTVHGEEHDMTIIRIPPGYDCKQMYVILSKSEATSIIVGFGRRKQSFRFGQVRGRR